ncbi:MAG: NAD(P)-dependent oxidoreductase [Chloroflexota bacterium]
MKFAIIGATGFIGSVILQEALDRGHQVTAIVRHPEKLPQHPSLIAKKGDVTNEAQAAALIAGHAAVISAYSPKGAVDIYQQYISSYRTIVNAVKKAGVKRLLVVGGAGSLEVAPGVQLVDTPAIPEEWKPGVLGAREALYLLRAEPELDWTFLSPSAVISPGERTGQFRLGTDQLLMDANGQSRITVEDYAVAMLDELENPMHVRQRFTVGY